MDERTWLLYGANGYTGRLIAEEAARVGARPILAGRREDAIRPLAERLGLPYRCFALDDVAEIARGLDGVQAVLLCAGPFSRTSAPVVAACLRADVHYLDITGEMQVFEACFAQSAAARERGVVLMPGVGFDVVPSDCLAASLKAALPGATRLELAFAMPSRPSAGTAKTMAENFGASAIREGGRVRAVPLAERTAEIPFRDRTRHAVAIPWGDLVTAYHSTGIGDIVVYMAMSRSLVTAMRMLRPLAGLAQRPAAQRLLQSSIERFVKGPGEDMRRTIRAQLWGRVTDDAGRAVTGTLETLEGYALTVVTALESARRVAAGGVSPGTQTPATAFGAGYITGFAGCDLRVEQ